MGYLDVNNVSLTLPDGRPLLDEVSFRVGEGSVSALIGANGAGKSTLLKIIRGDVKADSGAITLDGGLGVMDQFVGHLRDDSTVRDLLVSVARPAVRDAVRALDAAEDALIEEDSTERQMAYATALADYGDAGGYDQETIWDVCTIAAIGIPFERAKYRAVTSLSGGEQKRLALEALLRGPEQILLLDEPDNYLDVPGKRWLEDALKATPKTVLLVSHDRELLARAADRILTLELGAAGNTVWTHGGGFGSYHDARRDRMDRLDELKRRWDEQHAKIKQLVATMKVKATASDEFASRYRAAQTRLRKFEEAGPPQLRPLEQNLAMRLGGARTGRRALVVEQLELTRLMQPFDLEVWFGERVAVLGSNGSGKTLEPVAHTGVARLGARVVPGWFAQAHEHPELIGRTLLEILARGDTNRDGRGREEASRALNRYGLVDAAEQTFESLSGGQQARLQILLLELSGATMLLLDEPTDNLDLVSAEALQDALDRFEGTVLAVTHDRWFARSFDRFLVFGADGRVYESDEPVWDEGRVQRTR